MLRKVTRIFLKSSGLILLFLILSGILLYFGLQSYTFQTWLGQKASSYLSSELGSKVAIEKIELDFFTRLHLKNILILDKKQDTLFAGNITVQLETFDYRNKKIHLKRTTLQQVNAKLIRYGNDKDFNYQFLADYFDSGPSKKSADTDKWDLSYGEVILDNVDFIYRKEKYVTPISSTINFDDIRLRNISGKISGIAFKADTIYMHVSGLKTKEQSGFELKSLSTSAQISSTHLLCEDIRLQTPHTFVKGTIDFTYASWDDYHDFIDKVKMNCRLEDSTSVNFKDIASFAQELQGLQETVQISGKVKGYVSDMILSDIQLKYRTHTRFKGNISMSGLPDIESSFLHFDAKELSTNYNDLVHIPATPFHKNNKINLPEEMKRLGTISYRGKFDGFMNDFTSYGRFTSELGQLTTRLSIKLGEKSKDISYHGEISTTDFDLGTLLGQKDFNALTMKGEIRGEGIDVKNLNAQVEGTIQNINFNNYNYNNITLNGKLSEALFSGLLTSSDPNANFDFDGTINFANKIPEMDFISTINALDLEALHFTNKNDSGVLSSQIFLKINGDDLDNLTGQINFDNTIYKTKTRTFRLSTFNILLEQNTPDKKVRLNTEYLNATVYGRYSINNLKPAFESFLYSYYPGYFEKPKTEKKYSDELTFQIKIKKFKTINELFLPDVMVSAGTVLDGNFNAQQNRLNLQVNSGKLSYKSLFVTDLVFIVNENQKHVIAEFSGRSLHLSDSLTLDNFNFTVNSFDKDSEYKIDWDNLKTPSNKGLIQGELSLENSKINLLNKTLSVTLNDSTWNLQQAHNITIDKSGALQVEPMTVSCNAQKVMVSGNLSEKSGDSLFIRAEHVILEQFNPLLQSAKLRLEGTMDGDVSLTKVNKNYTYNGELSLNELKINNNTIGHLQINTDYNTLEKYISLNGYTSLGMIDESGQVMKNITFKGTYHPLKKEESLDIDFAAKPANLRLLNPLLDGIIDIKEGFVNGAGKISGTPDNFKMNGRFRLFRSKIKVDYTNVTYDVVGDIEIMPDQIRFSDLNMRENLPLQQKGLNVPQGVISGNIFHNNFNDIRIDYDINYTNMLILNTTEKENKTFYGHVYGTGKVGIYGFLDDIKMEIENTTNRSSKFYLPLDGPAEIGESDFIQFVKKDTTQIKKEKQLSGFSLEMLLHVKPNTQVQIIIDKAAGDVLNVQGQGDLKMTVNTLGKFEMTGDYLITDGDYLFTLENVINKKFDIQTGSSISWSGNPLGAEIDVVASYKQRASIAPLLNDTNASNKTRTPVDCKLNITGKLFSPNINFEIDFPNINANEKAKISSVLNDEAELNRQVFSFLLFRTFTTPLIYNTNGGGVTAGGAAASTGSELLSNRVSEFLNTYFGTLTGIRDLQLGLNYRPGTQSSGEAVDLALSKQFLDNKVSVDGNFGVNNNSASRNSNGLIGDVNIDYKLSQDGRLRLRGFNKTNDNLQSNLAGGDYTQGIGIFYRVEFETLGALYQSYLNKVRRKKAAKKAN